MFDWLCFCRTHRYKPVESKDKNISYLETDVSSMWPLIISNSVITIKQPLIFEHVKDKCENGKWAVPCHTAHSQACVQMRSEKSAPSFGSVSPVPPQCLTGCMWLQACLPSSTVKPRLGTRSQTTEETLSSLPWLSAATCSNGTQLSQQKRTSDGLFQNTGTSCSVRLL